MKAFDWEKFKLGDTVVHCKTEQECDNFLKMAGEHGFLWGGGIQPSEHNYFSDIGNNICYRNESGNRLRYDTAMYYTEDGFAILEWSDYMEFTKDDLRVGMLVRTDF